ASARECQAEAWHSVLPGVGPRSHLVVRVIVTTRRRPSQRRARIASTNGVTARYFDSDQSGEGQKKYAWETDWTRPITTPPTSVAQSERRRPSTAAARAATTTADVRRSTWG